MKKHDIKYSEQVLWLKPFVEEVKNIVPLYKLKSIKGYKVQRNKQEQSYGSLIKKDINNYTMNIKASSYDKRAKKYMDSSMSIILDTLAHELSHLIYWDHDWKHFNLQTKILAKFVKILKKHKILDTSFSVKVLKLEY